jgi:DME family drug/metabolite transporter
MGVVLAIVAAGCYATYTISAKRLADDGADMPAAVSVTLIAGGLLLTPWLVTAGPGLFSGRALLTAAWLGPVTTAVAYMLFVRGLRTISAAAAGTLSLAEPLVAALAGIGLLHEHLAAPAVIGCGLLVAGLACASLREPQRRTQPLRLALARSPGTGAVAGSAPDATAGSR